MKTAMESLKGMVDVNTVIGDPVETQDGSVIVPVSRVAFGFAAGGSEFGTDAGNGGLGDNAPGGRGADAYPFGGGSGAGVSVQPVGFLVVGQNQVRMLPVEGGQAVDRLIDMAPQILERVREISREVGRGGESGHGPDVNVPRTTIQ